MTPGTATKPASKSWLIVAGSVGAVLVAVLIWVLVSWTTSREPRLNEPTHVIAKFVSTRAFDNMPYEKQRLYYKILDDRGNKQIEHGFKSGDLSEGEYRTALDAAWLGRHINRFEKYAAMSGSARAAYIDELLVKKLKKDAEKKGKAGDDDDDDIDADETASELRVESWPAEVRQQWKMFHDAYRREKKAREAAATRPTAP
jgi:hypothetical protein